MLKKCYLGTFFWAPIPHKPYQNMSGFAGETTIEYSSMIAKNVPQFTEIQY